VETGIRSEITGQEEIILERDILQSQETQYLHRLENKLTDLVRVKRQLDELMKKVMEEQ
jgi:hypothetical protein